MPVRTPDYDPLMDELPPELAAKYKAEKRKRNIADLLYGQSVQNLQAPETKGRFQGSISPLEAIGQLAQNYVSNKLSSDADTSMADIGKTYQGMQEQAVSQYKRNTLGAPEEVMPPDVAGPPQPATVPDEQSRRQAITDAITGRDPRLARMGQMDYQGDLAAQSRKDVAQARLDQIETAKALDAERSKEAAKDRFAQAEYMARLAASLRPAPQGREEPAPIAVIGPDGKPMLVNRKDAIGKTPAMGTGGRSGAMSPTVQKELIQTDEEIQGGQAALTSLKQAKEISDKAMGFKGAGLLSSVGTLLPEKIRPAAVDATENLDNVLTASALPQLKAIFGGMPTEGERKILLDIQGSSNKSPSVRKDILERAEKAVEKRMEFSQKKAKALRGGTYFSDGVGAEEPPVAPPGGSVRVVDW
jgi:hypothetical protein